MSDRLSFVADSNKLELESKIEALCVSRYGDASPAHMKQLFLSYDADKNGRLSKDEVYEMFTDADVGTVDPIFGLGTRNAWVNGVFKELDKSPEDNELSWEEYLAGSSSAPPPTEPKPPAPAPPPVVGPGYGKDFYDPTCDPSTGLCYGKSGEVPAAASSLSGTKIALGLGAAGLAIYALTRS